MFGCAYVGVGRLLYDYDGAVDGFGLLLLLLLQGAGGLVHKFITSASVGVFLVIIEHSRCFVGNISQFLAFLQDD